MRKNKAKFCTPLNQQSTVYKKAYFLSLKNMQSLTVFGGVG